MHRIGLVVFLLMIAMSAFAQSKSDAQYMKEYEARLRKEKIDRIYIPKDLEDAHRRMDEVMEDEAKLGFMRLSDEEAARKYHFVFGRWLIKNWSLDRGSRLSAYLREKGIFRADDMAKFLVQTYHRKLHMRPLMEDALLAELALKYAAEKEERSKYKQVLSSEKRTRKKQ